MLESEVNDHIVELTDRLSGQITLESLVTGCLLVCNYVINTKDNLHGDSVDVRVVNKPCARKILERQSHKLCWKNSQMI